MPARLFQPLFLSLGVVLGFSLLLGGAASAGNATIAAKSVMVTHRLQAYARVAPISLAELRAAASGSIESVKAIPGQKVKAGDVLGYLAGPEIAALLMQHRNAVASGRASLQAAQRSLAIARENRAVKLATRESVFAAEATVAQDRAQLSSAEAALNSVENSATLRAPASGTIVSLAVADGERVATGQVLLTVQPEGHLWIEAEYYGADAQALRPGLSGQFVPADGAAPLPVAVASIIPVMRPDGGVPVGLRPVAGDIHLVSGAAGTVILDGPQHRAVAVPTQALILDGGEWWVLVRTPKGDEHRRVTPGDSRGNDTVIESGLEPGTEVIVGNAYLEFHRNVSKRYQPPD